MIPDELYYTAEHEWIRVDSRGGADASVVTIGITDFAQDALGDIVYVSLPETGETLTQGASVGELESTKSVSDLYAPLAGSVLARNEALDQTPELVNSDPYGEGWLLRVQLADETGLGELMDAAAYQAQVDA